MVDFNRVVLTKLSFNMHTISHMACSKRGKPTPQSRSMITLFERPSLSSDYMYESRVRHPESVVGPWCGSTFILTIKDKCQLMFPERSSQDVRTYSIKI